mgnify:CR=1 FL=1
MQPQFIIPIAIVFIVVGLPILCGTLIKLAKIIKGEQVSEKFDIFDSKSKSKKSAGPDKEEAQLVQEINQLVTRLEKRIDALETIVIDKTR